MQLIDAEFIGYLNGSVRTGTHLSYAWVEAIRVDDEYQEVAPHILIDESNRVDSKSGTLLQTFVGQRVCEQRESPTSGCERDLCGITQILVPIEEGRKMQDVQRERWPLGRVAERRVS